MAEKDKIDEILFFQEDGKRKHFIDEKGVINSSGYLIEDTHYSIKENIHADTYYYLKKFFQSKENCQIIADKLFEKLESVHNTLFVGYGDQSNHFLSLLQAKYKNKNNDYKVLEKKPRKEKRIDENYLNFQTLPTLELITDIIIILPIATTCSSLLQIKNSINGYIDRENENRHIDDKIHAKVSNHSYVVFLVCDNLERITSNQIKDNNGFYEVGENLYKEALWYKINSKYQINFDDRKTSVTPIKHLPSELYLAYECPLCYPNNPQKEIYLFPINKGLETPSTLLELPKEGKDDLNELLEYIDNKKNIYENVLTNEPKFFNLFNNSHLYGALKYTNSDYLNFIEGSKFYEENEDLIIQYFIKEFIEKVDSVNLPHICFITYDVKHSSIFLEDLILKLNNNIISKKLEAKRTTILRFNPDEDFIENFLLLINNDSNTLYVYYEDVISTGRTLSLLAQNLRYIGVFFDFVLTLVDRTTPIKKKEIKSILSDNTLFINDNKINRFISFTCLNVPVISSFSNQNPRQGELAFIKKMIDNTHLDSLKMIFDKEYHKKYPKDLDVVRKNYTIINNKSYGYLIEDKLLLLYIKHIIYTHLFVKVDSNFDLLKNNILFDAEFKDRILSKHKDINIGQQLETIILHCLTQHPFLNYLILQQNGFKRCLDLLMIEKFGTINHFQLLNTSILFNSNYIISEAFFLVIKKYFDENHNIQNLEFENIVRELATCIKKHVNDDIHKSAHLESVLNNVEITPESLRKFDDSVKIETYVKDRFLQFLIVIKAENLNGLSQILIKGSQDSYKKLFNPSIVKHKKSQEEKIVLRFIDSSFHNKDTSFLSSDNIKNSILSMLSVLELLREYEAHEKYSEDFDKQIRQLLEKILGIISQGIEDAKLDYAFCIEYRKKQKQDIDNSNIHTILRKDEENKMQVLLSDQGLIYKLLNGINKGESVQTFICLYYNEDKNEYESFEGDYLSSDNDAQSLDFRIKNDIYNPKNNKGIDFLKNAQTILLIRLAQHDFREFIDVPDSEIDYSKSLEGKAVLVISSNEKVTPSNFLKIVSVEKIRLLLLIKEKILDYLHRQFKAKAFLEVLVNRKVIRLQSSQNHGLNDYRKNILDAIKALVSEKESDKLSPIVKITLDAIIGQRFAQDPNYNFDKKEELTLEQFKMKVCDLLFSPYFFSQKVKFNDFVLPQIERLYIYKYITDVVILEIIRNIKSHGKTAIGRADFLNISVSYDDDRKQLVVKFANFFAKSEQQAKPIKKVIVGGLETHNECMKVHGFGTLEGKIDKRNSELFITTLTIKI